MDPFSALAEPKRRSIIELLAAHGQLSASAISQKFSISAPAISQHLKVLRKARFVVVEKRAQQRLYQLNPAAILEVEEWARQTASMWDERFNKLASVLASQQRKEKGEAHGNK